MRTAAKIGLGWIIPGGGYLLTRRYQQFAMYFLLVSTAFALGIALHGGNLWPQRAELQQLDTLTILMAKAGAFAKALAGGPYLIARLFAGPQNFVQGRLHEYGTTLLTMAGLVNLLALVDAAEQAD
jgi:hypothetical protein